MTGLETLSVGLVVTWLAILSVVVVLIVRQVALLMARFDDLVKAGFVMRAVPNGKGGIVALLALAALAPLIATTALCSFGSQVASPLFQTNFSKTPGLKLPFPDGNCTHLLPKAPSRPLEAQYQGVTSI